MIHFSRKSISRYFHLCVVFAALVNSQVSLASGCDLYVEYVEQHLKPKIDAIVAEMPEMAFLHESWQKYEKHLNDSSFIQLLPPAKVGEVLGNAEMLYFSKMFQRTMEAMAKWPDLAPSEALKNSLRETLKGQVPEATIEARINDLSNPTLESIQRALGDMTLAEVQTLIYGSDHLNPSPESLLGQYIAETGSATLRKAFPISPGSTTLGPEKLVISINQETFPVWQKLFFREEIISVINHADIIQGRDYHPYMGSMSETRLPQSEDKPLPILILKTTESQRMKQFLRADSQTRTRGWQTDVQQPWRLGNYCAKSAYANCTQKFGNIPIGDTLVDRYTFPGAMDHYAENKNGGPDDKLPRVQILQPYEHASPIVKRIWKVPGNQQLGEVIGQGEANLRSELANPGWVISTLIGPTTAERVPVVFIIKKDHKAPLPPNIVPQFERPL